jgi:hypothetical protein
VNRHPALASSKISGAILCRTPRGTLLCPRCAPGRLYLPLRRRSGRWRVGESAYRPGSVPPLARGGGHPSGTAVAGSLVRPTREHRTGRPRSLAQGTAGSPLDLAPGGVYRAAAVTCGAGGLLHRLFTLTPALARRRSVFCGTVPRVTPGRRYRPPCPVEPGPSSPDQTVRRDRPADSPTVRIRGRLPRRSRVTTGRCPER